MSDNGEWNRVCERLKNQTFSDRQREVWQLIAEGHPPKEIGLMLNITRNTAGYHRQQILSKLGTSSTALLVRAAIKFGLVEP